MQGQGATIFSTIRHKHATKALHGMVVFCEQPLAALPPGMDACSRVGHMFNNSRSFPRLSCIGKLSVRTCCERFDDFF